MKNLQGIPVRKAFCKTCPFLDTGWTDVRPLLIERALTDTSPICHSTGGEDALVRSQGPARICRGARDLQIQVLYRMEFLESPTDAAWEKKRQELGI